MKDYKRVGFFKRRKTEAEKQEEALFDKRYNHRMSTDKRFRESDRVVAIVVLLVVMAIIYMAVSGK